MNRKELFNENWHCLMLPDKPSSYELPNPENPDFCAVTVPHDALIFDAHRFYEDCVLWYEKRCGFTPQDGKRYLLYFEGVYMDATVYVNDREIGSWAYGYTSFFFEITDAVHSPEDRIFVRIRHLCPNSRWYGGPGINRNVWLYELPACFFTPDGLYLHTAKAGEKWTLSVSCELTAKELPATFTAKACISDSDGCVIFESERTDVKDSGVSFLLSGLTDIRIWDLNDPYLYTVTLKLYDNDRMLDTVTERFGFREIMVTTDRGFFLNGRHIKLNGVCLHTDGGALGMAFHRDMALRQLLTMQRMGANAIRFAHNPPAPEFLTLCDEYGMLVMDEAFDCWRLSKTEYDYARFFDDWHEKDMASFLRRDRNHPSVVLWSVGNEIYDTHKDAKEGGRILKELLLLVEKYDPERNAFATLCSNYMPWENTQKVVKELKLIGYNYAERLYEEHHKAHPDWVIYGSETASCVQSRGVYHFPLSKPLLSDADQQCSSLGNSTTSWGAKNHDFCIATERDTPFSLGQFLWAGIDYLGEPTPYHTKNSYLGICDTACFPKDAYYLYQAEWTDVKEHPMIHLLPYWDFNDGQLIDVRICSNADCVELFKDGKSYGKKTIDHRHGSSFYADYQLPYEPGELCAVAYDADGNVLCKAREHSFGEVNELRLSEEHFLPKKGEDRLYFVEINGIDQDGYEVQNASCRVHVTVSGGGFLCGLDNGDSTDYDSFQGTSKRLFNGKLLAIVRSDQSGREITVSAELDKNDIPVRKVALIAEGDTHLSPEHPELCIRVSVYPREATDYTLSYQMTNDAGVEIQNAAVSEHTDGTVSVRAVADGNMKLRALCHEKSGRVCYISSIELSASGFGGLYLNPYHFVSASLYTKSGGELGNGNENGICTQALSDSWAAYENVDFGSGSDEVVLPLFELQSEPLEVVFWDGIPYEENSRIVGRGTYNKPSVWNVYQEERFLLNERLKGVHTFAIAIYDHKTHIKGFCFTEKPPAFLWNKAREADEIYGDSFTVREDAVYGIGNNVSLVFTDFDFGDSGCGGITICGHTAMENNSIHLLLEGEGISSHQIVEFQGSSDFEERYFALDRVYGRCRVTFLFLPGCDFDFQSFRFDAGSDERT